MKQFKVIFNGGSTEFVEADSVQIDKEGHLIFSKNNEYIAFFSRHCWNGVVVAPMLTVA